MRTEPSSLMWLLIGNSIMCETWCDNKWNIQAMLKNSIFSKRKIKKLIVKINTFIMGHSNIRIAQFAFINTMIQVHVWCARSQYFRSHFLYQSLITLMIYIVNLCCTFELKLNSIWKPQFKRKWSVKERKEIAGRVRKLFN